MTWQSGVGLALYVDGALQTPEEDQAAFTGTTTDYDRVAVGMGCKFNQEKNHFLDSVLPGFLIEATTVHPSRGTAG